MAQLHNVYIRKGADSILIDWPEKSQNLILIVFLQSRFFHYQTRASLIVYGNVLNIQRNSQLQLNDKKIYN